MFFNYSKGMQVPGTDNLYQSFYYAQGTAQANPTPESTDNFDLGMRFRSRKVMGQLGGWYTLFHNRLASSYDQDLQATIYRNLGTVEKYGLDASVTVNANKYLSAYGFVSLMRSRIVSNVASGNGTYFATAGKRESGAPVSTMGARIDGHFDPLDIGVQVKRTGGRFINDQNLPVYVNGVQVSEAKAPAYTTVDLSARLNLDKLGARPNTYLQLNVTNLFNKFYIGGFDGTTANTFASYPSTTAYLPTPRTITGSISVAF